MSPCWAILLVMCFRPTTCKAAVRVRCTLVEPVLRGGCLCGGARALEPLGRGNEELSLMLGWRVLFPRCRRLGLIRARFQNANTTDRKQTADYYTHSTRATNKHFAPNEYAYPIRECFRALLLGCNEPIIFLSLRAASFAK
jgi:hypothetical protein